MSFGRLASGGSSAQAGTRRGAPAKVLLVDDDLEVLAITAELLADDGFEVTGAESAEAALDLIEQGGRFDAVVTDQSMPGLSGEELLQRCGRIPGLLITGYAEAVNPASGIRIMQKPVRTTHLLRELHEMVELSPG